MQVLITVNSAAKRKIKLEVHGSRLLYSFIPVLPGTFERSLGIPHDEDLAPCFLASQQDKLNWCL